MVDPGLLSLVQDAGRVGWSHLGVPRGGALDARAAALANRLVGNADDAAVVELTVTGGSFRCESDLTLAVTGAQAEVWVNDRHRGFAESFWVPGGGEVRVGPAREGLRSYLAVRGGIASPVVLGSRSTDTLAWVGPGPLRPGERLPVGTPSGAVPAVEAVPRTPWPGVLRIYPGPRWDWLTARAQRHLLEGEFRVEAASDRIALRLAGPRLERRLSGELPSEGIPDGAIQVPASGQPLIFLADHPVTGGYPVVAVVAPEDLDWCAQLVPGVGLRFSRVPAGWARTGSD